MQIDNLKVENIPRENLDTKLKIKFIIVSFPLNDISIKNDLVLKNKNKEFLKIKYVPISNFHHQIEIFLFQSRINQNLKI